jgi:predicted PurR-regulated permease PerM
MSDTPERQRIPWRIIFATLFSILVVWEGVQLLRHLEKIITWLVIAGFISVVLGPSVDFLVRHRIRRGLATLMVFLAGISLMTAMLYAFIRPLVDQTQQAVDNFPEYVADAKAGKGPVGGIVKRFNLDTRLEENQANLSNSLNSLGKSSLGIVRGVGNALAAGLTILVLSFLMILQGPHMIDTALQTLKPRTRERVRRVAGDCSKAVTGYVAGNLLISVVAGTATYIFLLIIGVPFAGVLALWVAFADLIPLVGATLGAIATVGVAFLHSPVSGVAAIIFYVVYQQVENHILQPVIMSRTVKLNPLAVLVSVLVGVELFGLLGALLAIPAAGIIQVIVRDIYDERQGRLKPEPTIGSEEVPISQVQAEEAAEAADGSPL